MEAAVTVVNAWVVQDAVHILFLGEGFSSRFLFTKSICPTTYT